MSKFLLRVEAVNLGQFVYDTEDLSTIRGGGLMLLNSPELVETFLKSTPVTEVKPILQGASQCVFEFTADAKTDPKDIRKAVEQKLRSDPNLGHATFVVAIVPSGEDFRKDKETLLTKNRWQQMRQLRLAPFTDDGSTEACGVDLVRPATKKASVRNEDKRRVSESTFRRHDYGRDQKHDASKQNRRGFYTKLGATLNDDLEFANDFHEIAARGKSNRVGDDAQADDPYSHLDDKLAVIYIDGNSFGKLQQQFVVDATSQDKWDQHIQDFRKKVLRKLIETINSPGLPGDRWRCKLSKPDRIVARLETLLWGGDELMWVVPAWQGLATVQLFFAEAARYYQPVNPPTVPPPPASKPAPKPMGNYGKVQTIPTKSKVASKQAPSAVSEKPPLLGKEGLPVLTHACGLVFCHADTPIQGVIKLAKELAEASKKANNKIDSLNYAVLESFDALGTEIDEARKKHLPPNCEPKNIIIPASDLNPLICDLRSMTDRFPRGSTYKILKSFHSSTGSENKPHAYETLVTRALREANNLPERFPLKFNPKDTKLVNWLHLAELWDYLGERWEAPL